MGKKILQKFIAMSGRKFVLPGTLVAVVLTAGLVWGVGAKYSKESVHVSTVKAGEFIFTSDLLTEAGATYTINADTGNTVSVEFLLSNTEGLRVSEMDVDYEVKVYQADGVTLATEVVTTPNSGTMTANKKTSQTVTISGLEPGTTYQVTAVGSKGYEKTLKATFIINVKDFGVFQNIVETAEYIELTVWTKNSSGDVKINTPAGLIPDSTDAMLAGIHNYNNETGTYTAISNAAVGSLGTYSSHVYRFFKAPEYTSGQITATVDVTAAVETAID